MFFNFFWNFCQKQRKKVDNIPIKKVYRKIVLMLLYENYGLPIDSAIQSHFKVRYGETDQMKNMYYGRYFEWFEVARVDWIKSRGLTYKDLEAQNCFLPVVELKTRYMGANHYDDEVCVYTWLKKSNRRSVEYLHLVKNLTNNTYTTEAEIRLIAVDSRGKSTHLPEKYFNSFQ